MLRYSKRSSQSSSQTSYHSYNPKSKSKTSERGWCFWVGVVLAIIAIVAFFLLVVGPAFLWPARKEAAVITEPDGFKQLQEKKEPEAATTETDSEPKDDTDPVVNIDPPDVYTKPGSQFNPNTIRDPSEPRALLEEEEEGNPPPPPIDDDGTEDDEAAVTGIRLLNAADPNPRVKPPKREPKARRDRKEREVKKRPEPPSQRPRTGGKGTQPPKVERPGRKPKKDKKKESKDKKGKVRPPKKDDRRRNIRDREKKAEDKEKEKAKAANARRNPYKEGQNGKLLHKGSGNCAIPDLKNLKTTPPPGTKVRVDANPACGWTNAAIGSNSFKRSALRNIVFAVTATDTVVHRRSRLCLAPKQGKVDDGTVLILDKACKRSKAQIPRTLFEFKNNILWHKETEMCVALNKNKELVLTASCDPQRNRALNPANAGGNALGLKPAAWIFEPT